MNTDRLMKLLRLAESATGPEAELALMSRNLGDYFWIEALSHHFPLYLSFKDGGASHAVAIAHGQVYDGHNSGPVDLEVHSMVKALDLIVVDLELEGFGSR